jgi:hypothetical protein
MYGLLNRAIKDLVESRFGEDTWRDVASRVSPDAFDFIAMKMYPDELTYDLVAAVSEVSGLTQHQVMDAFGEHWITYTGHIGHGDIISLMGDDTITFLKNLDAMHSRLMSIYTELEPPKFLIQEKGDGVYEMEYHSHRAGLWPIVIGMVRGLSALMKQNVAVRLIKSKTQPVGYDTFELIVTP